MSRCPKSLWMKLLRYFLLCVLVIILWDSYHVHESVVWRHRCVRWDSKPCCCTGDWVHMSVGEDHRCVRSDGSLDGCMWDWVHLSVGGYCRCVRLGWHYLLDDMSWESEYSWELWDWGFEVKVDLFQDRAFFRCRKFWQFFPIESCGNVPFYIFIQIHIAYLQERLTCKFIFHFRIIAASKKMQEGFPWIPVCLFSYVCP